MSFEEIYTEMIEMFLKNGSDPNIKPDKDNDYAETKSLATSLKDSGEIDENIARTFISKFIALVTEVYVITTEESKTEKEMYINSARDAELKLNNLLNEKGGYEKDLSISQYREKYDTSAASSMRTYAILFIFIVLIIGIIFLSGKLNRDLYPFMIFIFIISFPLLVIFRRDIYKILPIQVQSTKDLSSVERKVIKTSSSKQTKDMTRIGGIVFLNIFAILLLVTQSHKFFGIMLAMMCTVIAGTLVFDI